jgi:circadian clock protein KaiC
VSFFEPPVLSVARARRIGLEVAEDLSSGALKMLHLPPSELEADAIAHHILEEVARLGVQRLVVDGLSELERSISDPERRHIFMAALSVHLRHAGVTSLFTKEVSKLLGENLVLLRYVELRGRIHRVLSILKMRDSRYDGDLREFEIRDEGIRVLAPMRSVEGLLTGQARAVGTSIGGASS